MALLSVNGINFCYESKAVIKDVSITLSAGSLVGIVGPNGGGKSTLIKLLAKQMMPTAGEIVLKQQPLSNYTMKQLAKHIAYLPQHPTIPAGITVEQLVQYGRHPHQSWFRQWSEQDAEQVAKAIQLMNLESILDQSVASLSGGQRQRAWLAMILAQDTDIILLDEPTSALDIGHQIEVLESISEMVSAGKTVVLVIHDLAAAARYCDELIAIGEGKVIASGPVNDVITKSLIDSLYKTDVDIMQAPFDHAPVIVPRRKKSNVVDLKRLG
ncbi:ABC transporter ATP-binding protein [Motilimonas cestriensis]|uniref:ABC transporter ATP-binding protein n=1 Tax=Motilimonas cestriensis TaxID=2742685 RepID=A0ABS8WHA1_9GAMM|nr:ABC transporter ATP-binding protein [Motilimonas cestriensis]MCE2597011.1 ABC transporter ATP-binding protein [Motilimonas cestriensis]